MIGERIKTKRIEVGLSATELAEKASIAKETISRLENGRYKNVRVSTAMKIAEALGVSFLYLIGENDSDDHEITITNIGENLKRIREMRGLSRYRLAQETGIWNETIGLLENGGTNDLKVFQLVLLSKALEVSAADILEGKNLDALETNAGGQERKLPTENKRFLPAIPVQNGMWLGLRKELIQFLDSQYLLFQKDDKEKENPIRAEMVIGDFFRDDHQKGT